MKRNFTGILYCSLLLSLLVCSPPDALADKGKTHAGKTHSSKAHSNKVHSRMGKEKRDISQASSLGDDELDSNRGAGLGDTTLQISSLSATLADNSTSGGVTGNNAIADGALSNVSGIATFIQNSGNNVIIQNNMNLNVSLQ